MPTERTRYEITSADDKIIGTEYQYYYFINALLEIKQGQKISFEVKDDVHIELPNGKLVLIQVKHTLQKNAQQMPVNLTERDDDFWHTIMNWILVIQDKSDGRGNEDKQLIFVENTQFILVTNKQINSNNLFNLIFDVPKSLKNKENAIKKLKKYLKTLIANTDSDCKKEMELLFELNDDLLFNFISNIKIKSEPSDLIKEIKQRIKEKNIPDDRIEDVYKGIYSALKQEFFDKVQSGKKQELTFEYWHKKFTIYFEQNRTTTLIIREFKDVLPENIMEQGFIKELIEIKDIDSEKDYTLAADFTSYMINIYLNLKEWYDNGKITREELTSFHNEARIYWRERHRYYHRETSTEKNNDIDNSRDCLEEIRKKDFSISMTDLKGKMSNGEFYLLSNKGYIGWLNKWRDMYDINGNEFVL